jgi:hypothetical protein
MEAQKRFFNFFFCVRADAISIYTDGPASVLQIYYVVYLPWLFLHADAIVPQSHKHSNGHRPRLGLQLGHVLRIKDSS